MRLLVLLLIGSALVGGKRVAVIGGGMAGAFTTHFLSQQNDGLDITVFEKSRVVGGRVGEQTFFDDDVFIETGGTAILSTNKYLMDAIKALNLTFDTDTDPNATVTSPMGVWDGDSFRIRLSNNDIVATTQMISRYGATPLTIKKYVDDTQNKFQAIYDIQQQGQGL